MNARIMTGQRCDPFPVTASVSLAMALVAILWIAGGCMDRKVADVPLDSAEIFFNADMVESINSVEASERAKYLEQYTNKEITARVILQQLSATSKTSEAAKYGDFTLVGMVPDIYLKIDVYYDIYLTKELRGELGMDMTYTLSRVEVVGDVIGASWDPGGDRRLKVKVVAKTVKRLQ